MYIQKLEMEERPIVSDQTQSGRDVKGQHQPEKSCNGSHIYAGDNSGENIIEEEVSQAISIMEKIMNPCQSSNVKGQPACTLVSSVQDIQENTKESSALVRPKTDTLPLVEHSTNEEIRTLEVRPLPWVMSYDKVEEAVQDYEIETTSKFLVENPDRDFGKTFDEIKHSHHIHLDGGGFGNEVSPKLLLEGIPYIMMGNRKLSCHHGKPHNHSAKKVKGKRRLCTQASKKVGCPSQIIIRHVMLLLDFKFDASKVTEHRRRELSKQIKSTLKDKGVTSESRFYIEFPDVNSHRNHPLGEAAGVKQPIDKRVNEKMLQLIGNGMKSIQLIEQSLKDFVKDELFRDSPCPPHSNRRFFPTQKDIANRIFKVSASSLSSKLKIDKLEDLVYGLLEEQRAQNGFVFFRSSVGTNDPTLECSDKTPQCSTINQGSNKKHQHKTKIDSTENGSFDATTEGLLFVYQTYSQRQLLARYGSDLTFLDPAHRAADYAVPLYFLLVHTNCDYQIVAVIAMERESGSDLREALAIIKKDNPGWRPQQFVVDASHEEIQIVEKVFPECRVFISDIRREQAWERWLANPKHGTVNCQQELLTKMAAVATARTVDSYQAAMDTLKATSSQANFKLMRAWFREKWLSNIGLQRWAYVFRQQRQMLPLIMNNGIESQREAMRYDFITSNRNYTLHNMLSILINTVLPDLYGRYVQVNTEWSTITNTGVPSLLYNRPKPFIDHCQQRITNAKTQMRQPSTDELFHSPDHPNSSSDGSLVDLSIPSCTCQDFTRTGYLCEHLLDCITNRNELLWQRLPSSYLFSPFLTVDEGVVGGEGEQIFGAGDNDEEEECVNTASGLSPEEEATSNLEAILAAVEAQTSSACSSNYDPPIPASTSTTEDTSFHQIAARCQLIAKQVLDLTQTVTDKEVLAAAQIHMEASLATLKQAIPTRNLNNISDRPEHTCKNVPIYVGKGCHKLDGEVSPLKKPRLLDGVVEDELVLLGNQVVDSEISICANEIVEGYEASQESLDIQESIVTETIDLQHGAVFILDPSGVMRNFQLPGSETNPTLTKNT